MMEAAAVVMEAAVIGDGNCNHRWQRWRTECVRNQLMLTIRMGELGCEPGTATPTWTSSPSPYMSVTCCRHWCQSACSSVIVRRLCTTMRSLKVRTLSCRYKGLQVGHTGLQAKVLEGTHALYLTAPLCVIMYVRLDLD